MPSCVAALSPWTDLTGALRAVRANDGRCAMFRPRNIPDFAAAYLGGASSRDPRASPRFGSFADFPPTLLQVAATELLLDDAREAHAALGAAGAESTLEVVEGVFHAWHLLAGFVPEADAALARAAAFIDAHLPAGT
jgi:acetyl esterase/lipase